MKTSVVIAYEDIWYHFLTNIKVRALHYFNYKMASVQMVSYAEEPQNSAVVIDSQSICCFRYQRRR
jgi:hypothetical protein